MDNLSNLVMLSLEQATVLPYLSYRLAQDGVRVIRLEHPIHGDPNRMVGDNVLGEERMNSYFLCINAGKQAITLDLSQREGQEILKELILKLPVDIFATNQLPKNYRKLGIDYEGLKAIKPDLIWIGITGFGPLSNEAAYDPILQARSGLMELTGEEDGFPQVLGIPLADMGTSEHAYGQIMKALYRRAVTGKGSCINISMFHSSVSWLTVPITLAASFGKKITRRGNTHEFFAPVSVYEARDGYVYIAVGNDRQWKSIVALEEFKSLNLPQYETNSGRIEDVDNLNKAINNITRQMSVQDLIKLFNSITVPISKINTIQDVLKDEYVTNSVLSARDFKSKKQITLAPPPIITDFLEKAERQMSFPPRFGEHNEHIYCDLLKIPRERLKELKTKKII